MATSLIINYKNGEKKGQKALTAINESASNADLYNFAQNFLALSTYSFESAKKVVTTELTASEANNNG